MINNIKLSELPSDAYSRTFTKCLNDFGSGSFKVLRSFYQKGICYDGDETTLLGNNGSTAFAFRLYGNVVFAFVYESESFVVKDGYYEITYSGAGVMSILEHAMLWPNPTLSQLTNSTFTYMGETYSVDTSQYGNLAARGVYTKNYGKTVNGAYVQTEPRLIGNTLKSIVDNYNNETAARNANSISLVIKTSSIANANIGDYKKECGTAYSDIFIQDLANQLQLFLRDEYTETDISVGIYLCTDDNINKGITFADSEDNRIEITGISGNYSSKENYQSYLTVSNDIMMSCRDGLIDGKEGTLAIADYADPAIHAAYSNQFINHNTGSIVIDMELDGTGTEPFASFDVGDLITWKVGDTQIADNNRVLSITVNISSDNVTSNIELNANDKADYLIDLPKIISREQKIRELQLKSRMPSSDQLQSVTMNGNDINFVMGSNAGKSYTLIKDSSGKITGIKDNTTGTSISVNLIK